MAALLKAAAAPDFPAEVALVISNRADAAGLRKAEASGAPTLLIEAGNSVTPPGQMRQMHEVGADAEYVCVPGVGHLVHDEAPEEFRRVVTAFLAAHRGH